MVLLQLQQIPKIPKKIRTLLCFNSFFVLELILNAWIELPIVFDSSSDAWSNPLFDQALSLPLNALGACLNQKLFWSVPRRCGWIFVLVFRRCGKKYTFAFRSVGFHISRSLGLCRKDLSFPSPPLQMENHFLSRSLLKCSVSRRCGWTFGFDFDFSPDSIGFNRLPFGFASELLWLLLPPLRMANHFLSRLWLVVFVEPVNLGLPPLRL